MNPTYGHNPHMNTTVCIFGLPGRRSDSLDVLDSRFINLLGKLAMTSCQRGGPSGSWLLRQSRRL